jgi:hypothetical protein
MGSTPNNCLGVLDGIPPVAERLAYLKFRFLVAAFYRLGHSLRERLGVLGGAEYVSLHQRIFQFLIILDIVSSESFTRHVLPAFLRTLLVDGNMEKKLANVQEAMY